MDYTALVLGNLILTVHEGGRGRASVRKRENTLAHYVELLFYSDIMGVEGVGNSRVLLEEDSCQPLALALCSFCLGQ